MNKIKALFFALTFVATSLVTLPQAVNAAGSASLSLSPGGGGHNVGSTFAVTVIENSGATAVNGVEADLAYDASKLQVLGKSCGGGFEIAAPSGGSNLACATVTPKSGSQAVGTVSFKAIAAGSGAISFLPSSQITSSDGAGTNVWNGAAGGGTYSLVTPVAAAPRPRVAAATTSAPTPAPAPVATPEPHKVVTTKPSVTVVAVSSKKGSNILIPAVLIALLIGAIVAAVEYMPKRKKTAAVASTSASAAKKPSATSKKKVAVATLAVASAGKTTKKSVKKPTAKKTK